MRNTVNAQVVKICVVVHFLAWCAVATVWAVKWWSERPAPSGPRYNSAKDFIENLDILVYAGVHESTLAVGAAASAWLSADPGAALTITFAGGILLAGTLQWFLLGKLVQWVALHGGRRLAGVLLGLYGVWAAGGMFLWVAS
jgi:hypothetical protein